MFVLSRHVRVHHAKVIFFYNFPFNNTCIYVAALHYYVHLTDNNKLIKLLWTGGSKPIRLFFIYIFIFYSKYTLLFEDAIFRSVSISYEGFYTVIILNENIFMLKVIVSRLKMWGWSADGNIPFQRTMISVGRHRQIKSIEEKHLLESVNIWTFSNLSICIVSLRSHHQ